MLSVNNLPPHMTLAAVRTVETLFRERPFLNGNCHFYEDDKFNPNGTYIEFFTSNGWEMTITVHASGSIGIDGFSNETRVEIMSQTYETIVPDFYQVFDSVVVSPVRSY